MTSNNSTQELDQIFSAIKTFLPSDWMGLPEELRLHHLLSAINKVLKPSGSWILVNGEMTLLELITEKSNGENQ